MFPYTAKGWAKINLEDVEVGQYVSGRILENKLRSIEHLVGSVSFSCRVEGREASDVGCGDVADDSVPLIVRLKKVVAIFVKGTSEAVVRWPKPAHVALDWRIPLRKAREVAVDADKKVVQVVRIIGSSDAIDPVVNRADAAGIQSGFFDDAQRSVSPIGKIESIKISCRAPTIDQLDRKL
mgnify:FL=1